MPETNPCPNCGAERPAYAPEGLCPRCLLGAGLPGEASEVSDPRSISTASGSRAPGSAPDTTAPARRPTSRLAAALTGTVDPLPAILLRDTGREVETPVSRPASAEIPDDPGRYQLLGEIARGGMGAVLKGRDLDLGRDLAVKILLDRHRDRPELVRRFVEEAQIAGQLQHPGIVPVYELGTLADRRPFFSMKLVKGRTLAALLDERGAPGDDWPRLLGIFEQVCQTVAYGHARGVIHRDLKPSNVMVGAFGEVQVMDWGLAKVLTQGGAADDLKAGKTPAGEPVNITGRAGPVGALTAAGSVMGTPSYMAPEQARGEADRVDERADVFALGSILCEVLTGQPAFVGGTTGEIQSRAAAGDLAEALARLGASEADPDLVALAEDCLAPEPGARPRDAGALAGRVTGYLAGVQERLRAAELARARAEARAAEERRRRRMALALAGSVLALILTGGGGIARYALQRQALLSQLDRLLDRADTALAGAEQAEGPVAARLGEEARLAMGQAEVLAGNLDEPTRAARLRALRQRGDHGERFRALLSRLKVLRLKTSVPWLVGSGAHKDYEVAFRTFGLDLDTADAAVVAGALAGRPASAEVAAALDQWAAIRRLLAKNQDDPSWRRLVAAAQRVDPDRWRNELRSLLFQPRAGETEALTRLADDPGALARQPALSLVLLASRLRELKDFERAGEVLRVAWQRSPGDAMVNMHLQFVALGLTHGKFDKHHTWANDVVRFQTAVVAADPEDPVELCNLGYLLTDRDLDGAIDAYRAAILLQGPVSDFARSRLADTLMRKGDLDGAVTELRTLTRQVPDHAGSHAMLGAALNSLGRTDEAIAESREAVRLKADDALIHYTLATALRRRGSYDAARAEARTARELIGRNAEPPYWILPGPPGVFFGMDRDPPPLSQVETFLSETERLGQRAVRLAAVLKGEVKPGGTDELLDYGQVCSEKGYYATASRLLAAALSSDPTLAADRDRPLREGAARAAALAGSGLGKEDPPPDPATKADLRRQARGWLRAELATWDKALQNDPKQADRVVGRLRHWKMEHDLAGVRDPEALANLPAEERAAWKSLWADVDALLAKARTPGP